MSLSRYLDLYLTETQEHLRRLDRGLLDLEETGERTGLEAAFRAVHTLKGMSASMGFSEVADLAHAMEDRLEALRQGRSDATPELIDQLLAEADRLRAEVDRAAEGQAVDRRDRSRAANAVGTATERRRRAADAPDGTVLIVRVWFRSDAPLVGARAVMAVGRIREMAGVRGFDPPELDDTFRGELTVFLAEQPDRRALEAAIRSAGEVQVVAFGEPGQEDEDHAAADRALRGASSSDEADQKVAESRPGGPAEPPGGESADGTQAALRRRRFLRVDLKQLDNLADGIAELAILQRGIALASERGEAERLAELESRAAHLVGELQSDVLEVRMVPVGEVFDRFPLAVRDAARRLERQVDFRIEGHGIELDRAILDEVADPLLHLLRNAVGHGIESPEARVAAGKPERGRLTLSAERERSRVLIRVSDDGAGVDRERVLEEARARGLVDEATERLDDEELLRVVTTPGVSTAEHVTDVSGRGVGLDVVAERVRALGGALDLGTSPGQGTTFSIRLPLTLAVAQALRVGLAGERYVVPLTHVAEALELEDGMSARVKGAEVLRLRGQVMPLLRLGTLLGLEQPGEGAAVVVEVGERRTALAVDALMGREQIVIREFDAARGTLPVFSGATLLADGTPALVLDPVGVTQSGRTHG